MYLMPLFVVKSWLLAKSSALCVFVDPSVFTALEMAVFTSALVVYWFKSKTN